VRHLERNTSRNKLSIIKSLLFIIDRSGQGNAFSAEKAGGPKPAETTGG
jgi:hypothetical protein